MKTALDNDSPFGSSSTAAPSDEQLADKLKALWGNTFVIHCCGLIRRLRNISLYGALRIFSRPCYRFRIDTSLFLLVVVEVVTSTVLYLRLYVRTIRSHACASLWWKRGTTSKKNHREKKHDRTFNFKIKSTVFF